MSSTPSMRAPETLTKAELVALVEDIQDLLYRDPETSEPDPNKEWDGDTIEYVADALDRFGLTPQDTP